MNNIIEITNNKLDFSQYHNNIVIDFWAQWCGPCIAFAPTFESVSKMYDKITFLKINIDENEQTAQDYKITTIPTTCFIRDTKVIDRHSGTMSETQFKKIIDELFNQA